jgi:hypothetical protein
MLNGSARGKNKSASPYSAHAGLLTASSSSIGAKRLCCSVVACHKFATKSRLAKLGGFGSGS